MSLVGNGAQQIEQILRRPRQAIQAGNNGLARPLRRQIGHGGLEPSCGRRKLDLVLSLSIWDTGFCPNVQVFHQPASTLAGPKRGFGMVLVLLRHNFH